MSQLSMLNYRISGADYDITDEDKLAQEDREEKEITSFYENCNEQ